MLPALAAILETSFTPMPEMVRACARARPGHPAIIQGERTVTYAQLDTLIERVAASLQRDGFAHGDVVAICANGSIEYGAVFLGALRIGVAVAPLAPSSTAESLRGMLENAEARLFFVDAPVRNALGTAPLPNDARCIALDGSDAGWPFGQWLVAPDVKAQPVDVQPEWPFNLIYSSGTTGAPKGIVQSCGMRWQYTSRATRAGYDENAVTLISTPLYSNTTLVSFFPTLALGGTVVLLPKFDAGEYLRLAERHRVTHSMLVPVQYQRIMARPDFDSYDLSSFKIKFCTSAPFNPAVKADVLKRWPGGLVEYYGMTEGGGGCELRAHEHPDKLHTVGVPHEGCEIRFVDESGEEVPLGEKGEIVGHSASMMLGYHRQPEKTTEALWYDKTGKCFIRTGDVGRMDEDGFVVLMDRKKDMIISGGFNIYPSDLEGEVLQHPAVSEVAVIGVPSEKWGETPVAYVVLREGSDATGDEIMAWVNQRVGKTQRLAALEVVGELPRSAIGKVLKRELRDKWAMPVA